MTNIPCSEKSKDLTEETPALIAKSSNKKGHASSEKHPADGIKTESVVNKHIPARKKVAEKNEKKSDEKSKAPSKDAEETI